MRNLNDDFFSLWKLPARCRERYSRVHFRRAFAAFLLQLDRIFLESRHDRQLGEPSYFCLCEANVLLQRHQRFTTRLNRPSMASASCFAINAVFSSSAYTFSQQSLLKLSYLQSTCHVLCPNNTARYDARKLFCRVASGRAVCNRHYATRYKCDMRLLFFVTP